MIALGDTKHPLCLLDTLAVSEMVKRPDPFFHRFYDWALEAKPIYIPCFSPFTMIELRRSPAVWEGFVEKFQPLPAVLLKGYDWLLKDELAAYPDPSGIEPNALAFTPLGGEGNLLKNFPTIWNQDPTIRSQEEGWNRAGPEIVKGMVSLVENFQPEGDTYTASEVRTFLMTAGLTQLYFHDQEFVARTIERDGQVDTDAFPSLKAMLYTTFHKFYVDKDRKHSDSDAFDIIMASATPYVEAIVTENHQAEVLDKIKRRDDFIKHLQVFALRDFR